MAKRKSTSTKSSKPESGNVAPSVAQDRARAKEQVALRQGREAKELTEREGVVVPAVIPADVVRAAAAKSQRSYLDQYRQDNLLKAAENLEKRNEAILAERKERAEAGAEPGGPKQANLNPADGPELILENPNDEVLEASVAGETYYLKPGDNRIVSRDSRLTDVGVATYLHGKFISRGVIFRKEGGMASKKSAGPKSAEAEVNEVMQNISTEGEMDVPDPLFEGIKFTSNPSASNRAQPERFQASGPLDPDGTAARERKRKLVKMAVTGELPSETGTSSPKKAEKGKKRDTSTSASKQVGRTSGAPGRR